VQLHDLSFDPLDPYWEIPGGSLRWAVQVFTLSNVYGLEADAEVQRTDDSIVVHGEGFTWGAGAFKSGGKLTAEVRREGRAWVWRITAQHAEPIKSIKLLVRGIPSSHLQSGWWHATTDAGEAQVAGHKTAVQLDYPNAHEWQTPWVAVGTDDEALTISVRDSKVHATRFFAHTPPWADGETIAEIICEDDATQFGTNFEAPPIRVAELTTSELIFEDFSDHLSHVERVYGLRPWAVRADVPAWARKIRLVLNLHGQHWTGKIFNTFDDMAQVLRFVSEHIPGEQVIAYLPGWEGRYYWQYPWFTPAESLGGPDAFARLAATADELGITLMPMFGAHGANAQIYPQWADATFLNTTARYPVLLNKPDWDGDRAGEDDQVFLNTGNPEFRALLVDQVSAMVREYGVRVAYFDTTAAWFNDPRFNLYEGYRSLKNELAHLHPNLMIAGEGWTDALLAIFPLNLSWLGSSRTFRRPELLHRYGRAVQHLLDGAPGLGSTGVYEGGFTLPDRAPVTAGHLRSISFVDNTLQDVADDVIAICTDARE